MSLIPHDIKDDEIRVISSGNNNDHPAPNKPTRKRKWIVAVSIIAMLLSVLAIVYMIIPKNSNDDSLLSLIHI